MEPAPESPRFKGVLSSRPFELGKPVAKTSVGDDTVEEKSPFGVTAVKVGTIESLNFPVSSKSEPETKQKEFEWGRPLLGGSSDEEDYEEEEDSDGKTVVFESAAPVYLEKEPGEVSIPLHSSVDKSVNPDKEVIEEYVDQEGRQVKRISKLTTTKTITRVERQTPTQEMDIDVPSEPKEDIEEYTDEHGQRVRRVVRTSFTTTTKTVLRDGSVKVVLKPDDLGDGELKEGPEDVENIVTSTSEDGRRAQKLSKSTFTTQLKGRLQPVAFAFPSTQEDDQPPPSSQTEDENEKSPAIRERKRTDPPDGPSEVPEIPRKRAHKEISIVSKSDLPSPTPPIAQDGGARMEIEDEEGRDEESEDEDFDEFDEEIIVVEMKKHPRVPKWFVAVPGEPGKPVKAEGLDYLPKITTLASHEVERPEVKENVFCVSVERKVTIPELSSPYDEISQSKLPPTKTDDQSLKGVDETKDDLGTKVFESAAPVYLDLDSPEIDRTEGESPEEVEEYVDENGVRVKRIVKRVVTTTSINSESYLTKPVEVEFAAAHTDDESPEEVEEYIDENGMRVRRIVRRTITNTTIRREGQQIEPVEIECPAAEVAHIEDGTPEEEVEEYVDENGVRVKRVVRRTITTATKTIKREGQQVEPVEVKFPVAHTDDESLEEVEEYIDENGVRVKRIVKRVVTTTSIKREDQQIEPVEIKFPVAHTEDESPEEMEEYIEENGVRVKRIVKRVVTTTSIKREGQQIEPVEIEFPVARTEDESPEEVEEYIDENGVRVKRIVKRVVTTTSIKRQDQQIEPVEIEFPVASTKDESPEEVEEYIDENGVRVKRIVKRVVTTTSIKREDQQIEPVEIEFPVASTKDESPEEVEEYIDENGVHVRRIVRRTITTRSVIRTSGDEGKDDLGTKVFESAAPVYLETDSEDVTPSVQIRKVVVPEWMEESEPQSREPKQHSGETSVLILPYQPAIPEAKEDRERYDVMESVTAATLNQEIVIPEIDGMEDTSPEEFEEYVDENGVRVRRIVKRVVTTATIKRPGKDVEPTTAEIPIAHTEGETPDEVEEYVDENGFRVRRIIKRTITTTSIRRQDERVEPTAIEFPVAHTDDESPEEVEEYIDENGVRVKRIVKRVVTTTSIKRQDQQIEPVEIEFPVASTKDESPEEVEEYIDENGVRVKRIVKRVVTTTSIKREDQQIEPVEIEFPVASTKDESPEEVEEYIDENGVHVRRIVRRTITTRSVIRTSGDEGKDNLGTKVFESAAPVYLETDSEDVAPSVQIRKVVVPEWMEESEPQSREPKQHSGDTSVSILPYQPAIPKAKEDRERYDVMENVTATTLNQEIVIPEIDGMEDTSPEEFEEYVDENGVRVRRIVKRVVTTATIKRPGKDVEPTTAEIPIAHTEGETPDEVEEYVDENGFRVRRIIKRTITTTSIRRQDERVEPTAIEFPVAHTEDETPEEVEEYTDENGVRVRRIIKRTITTTSTRRQSEKVEPTPIEFPVARTEDETPEEVEEYIDENGVRVRRIIKRTITTTSTRRQGEEVEPTAIEFPVAHTEDETPEEVEEYTDENGVRVRRIIKRTITTTSTRRQSEKVEPTPIEFPVARTEDETPEEVEEYIDENGVRVRRIIKRTITTTSIRRQGEEVEPTAIEFPVAHTEDEAPEEVEEYTDENGVRVRRIIKRTITTTSTRRQSEKVEPTAIELPVARTVDEAPEEFEEYIDERGVRIKRVVTRTITRTVHQRSTQGTIGMHKVVEEVAPSEETETVETVAPESATFSQTELTSSRRVSIPYKTTVVQRYLVIIETLYQYVLEHKSMIFIYSSRHMRFSFVLENFLQWMLVTLKKLSWMRPVSWKVDEIKMQLQEIKVLLSDGVFVDVHDGFNVIGGNLHEHCMPHKIAWCM